MADVGGFTGALKGAAPHAMEAGDLAAVFLPGCGMLGASLRHRGAELLGRVEDLESLAAKGSTGGIPLLHPWANRLARFGYNAAGREVALDAASPLLHLDEFGLPIHGVPWARLAWEVTEARKDRLAARLDWTAAPLLAVFPYRHRLEMVATLRPDALILETILAATGDAPVPASFGFHPYFALPGARRAEWRLRLPPMRRLALDGHQIPTGADEPFVGMDAPLGAAAFDDGFALAGDTASFALEGGGRRISVDFLEGYPCAQVFAPRDKPFVALEPMTAPTNALASGDRLRLVAPGDRFRATFRVGIAALA